MKPRNAFATLTEQDRDYIRDLCSKQQYDDIVALLAKPRAQGGLDLKTSTAALSRFFTTYRPDPSLSVLAQQAAADQVRHEQHNNAFLGAIRAVVEARLLETLKAGKALSDMEKDFKALKTIQNLYLADIQWRARNPKVARAAYHAFIDNCATASDDDFIPAAELDTHPNAAAFAPLTHFERDIVAARQRQQREAEERQHLIATLQSCGLSTAAANPTPSAPAVAPSPIRTAAPSAGTWQKSPAISPIPPNSSSEIPSRSTVADPPSNPVRTAPPAQKITPIPFIRTDRKVGRNDPCPCGSGKKFKKCCLAAHPQALAA